MNRIQIILVIWGIIFHVYEQGYKEDVNYVPICPENLEVHKKRAIEVCPHEPQKYHCLPVRNFSTFIEDCKQPYYYRHGTCLVWDRPGVIDANLDIENGPENSYLSNTFNVGCRVPSDSTTIFSSSPSTTPSSTSTTTTGSSTSTTPSSTTFSTSPLMKESLSAAQIAGIVIGIKRCRRYKRYEKANSEKTLKMGSQSSGRKLEKKNEKLEHGYDNKKTITGKCETGFQNASDTSTPAIKHEAASLEVDQSQPHCNSHQHNHDQGTSLPPTQVSSTECPHKQRNTSNSIFTKQHLVQIHEIPKETVKNTDQIQGYTVSGSQGDLDIPVIPVSPRAFWIEHPQPVPKENEDLTSTNVDIDDIPFEQRGPTTRPLSEKVFEESTC